MKKRILSLVMAFGLVLSITSMVFAGPQPGTSTTGGPQQRISQTLKSAGTSSACGPGDVTCFDRRGVIGGNASGTTDPMGLMMRGKQCSSADGTCTPGNVVITGGAGIIDIQIDGADPSTSCAGDNDSVTFTVANAQGTAVISAVALTEGTQWTATASVADTCASLASAFETACTVSGVDYCNASCTSPEVRFSLTPAASAITSLTESTAGCTTVATLGAGNVLVGITSQGSATPAGSLCFSSTSTCLWSNSATAYLGTSTGGITSTLVTGALTSGAATLTGAAGLLLTGGRITCGGNTHTCADGGNPGVPAACSLTSSDVRCAQVVTCSDADGCALTLDETSGTSGSPLWIYNAGTNAVTIADSAGVQETNADATLTLGQLDNVWFVYGVDSWVQSAPISNN